MSGVASTDMSWFGWDNLSDACGTLAEAFGQELEVGELVVNGFGDLDAAFFVETKGFLEMGEHAHAARDGESDAAKFAGSWYPGLVTTRRRPRKRSNCAWIRSRR
jgi:hypothetical protein